MCLILFNIFGNAYIIFSYVLTEQSDLIGSLRKPVSDGNHIYSYLVKNYINSLYFIFKFCLIGSTWAQEMVWCIANNLDYEGAKVLSQFRAPVLE